MTDPYADTRKLLPLQMAALAYAQDELAKGVEETSPNDSPAIRAYLAEAGIEVPAPWCAAFVNWCARKAADAHGVHSPLEDVPLEALVQSYVDYGQRHGWIIDDEQADAVKPGDLFCLWYPHLNGGRGRYGHIGFVREVPALHDGERFGTIEGNSNTDGSREGTKVVAKQRPVTGRTLFLRWWED